MAVDGRVVEGQDCILRAVRFDLSRMDGWATNVAVWSVDRVCQSSVRMIDAVIPSRTKVREMPHVAGAGV